MRKILRAGLSLALVSGLAACAQMTDASSKPPGTPNKSMGMNATGVTGQLPGTRSGTMTGNTAPPAQQ